MTDQKIAQRVDQRERASSVVHDHLASVLPANTPPNYREIVSARFIGTGRSQQAVADLLMFDGFPATVRVFGYRCGIAGHRFINLPGGDCSYEGGQWVRIDPETIEPYPPLLAEIARLQPRSEGCV